MTTQDQLEEIYIDIAKAQETLNEINNAINRDKLEAEQRFDVVSSLIAQESMLENDITWYAERKLELDTLYTARQQEQTDILNGLLVETQNAQQHLQNIKNEIDLQNSLLEKNTMEMEQKLGIAVQDYQDKLDLLISKYDEILVEYNTTQETNKQLKQDNVNLLGQKASVMWEIKDLIDNKISIQTDLAQYTNTLNIAKTTLEATQQTNEQLTSDISNLQTQQETLNNDIIQLQIDKQNLLDSVEPMQKEIAEFTQAKMKLSQDQLLLAQKEETIREKYTLAWLNY